VGRGGVPRASFGNNGGEGHVSEHPKKQTVYLAQPQRAKRL
jgi:hypothetical protein